MTWIKKLAGVAIAATLLGGTVVSAGGHPASSERAAQLTVGVTASVRDGYQAARAAFGRETLMFQAVYDSLIRMEPDGTLVPHLATEWSYDDTRTVLTLTLRDDVSFTDGTPFNADAAAQNLTRFRDTGGRNANFLALMESATAIDDTHVEIKLSEPNPALLSYLSHVAGLQQSPATFDGPDADTNPVGTGPYIINTSESVVGTQYVYDANPDYFAPELIKFDRLVLRIISDDSAMINAIRANELNAADVFSAANAAEVERAGWDLHPHSVDWSGLLLIDREGALGTPLGDVRVRQAINMAFPREDIVQALSGGLSTATTQVFRTGSPGYDESLDANYPYDPEAAKALLAEAGFPNGFTLDMPLLSTPSAENSGRIVAAYLGEIGIAVNFHPELQEYVSNILQGKYPAAPMLLEQAANDWQFIGFQIARGAPFNPLHTGDDVADELIAQIQVTEGDEQAELVAQLGRHIHEQAWFAPLSRSTSFFATDGTVDVQQQTGNINPYIFNFSPQG